MLFYVMFVSLIIKTIGEHFYLLYNCEHHLVKQVKVAVSIPRGIHCCQLIDQQLMVDKNTQPLKQKFSNIYIFLMFCLQMAYLTKNNKT